MKGKEKMHGNELNLVELGDNSFAVRKELLSPWYYKNVPQVKDKESQVDIDGMKFVVVPPEAIVNDLDSLTQAHPMDDYGYPYDGGSHNKYPNKRPYAHQIYTSRWLHTISQGQRGLHVHSSMGTGKSLSCLWTVDYLFSIGAIKKVLIVAPKIVMRSAWQKEINNEMMWLTSCIKQGVSRNRRSTAQIDIINHDGITARLDKFKKKVGERYFYNFELLDEDYDIIIYDECTALKNVTTGRWKALNKWFSYLHSRYGTRLWLLTGTPLAQSPMDAYGLAKIVNPDSVTGSLEKWRQLTMWQKDKMGFKWEPREDAVERCAAALQPSLRFELSDCTDLPDHQFYYITVDKTEKQTKLFEQISRDFIAEIDASTTITINNGAAKATKLLQLLSGCIYDESRATHETDASNKFEALIEIIDQLPDDQPVVVFTDFIHVQEWLHTKLSSHYKGKTIELINGSVSGEDRSAICNRVLSKQTKVVICHTVTTALGVDFTSTNVIIYFSPTMRNELYLQSLDRIRRLSSVEKGFTTFLIFHIICDVMEKKIYEGLQNKSMTQNQMLQMMRDELVTEFNY